MNLHIINVDETHVDPSKVCKVVRQLVGEIALLLGNQSPVRLDRGRANSKIRHIAIYMCHVVLGLPMQQVANCFARDRTTISYACQVIEDRRDDPVFENFISAIERITLCMFRVTEVNNEQ